MSNAVKHACEVAGGQAVLARRLQVSEAAVSTWVRRGWVPLRRAAEIELKFGVARQRLINPRILDLVQALS
ncbi:MAG: hypothetical protein CGW95_06570 [Phenylobacterium zucineum]|nr:MAG: hypothetical protein CGW95_06570 [Phenylobacterium zucineum]